MNEFKRMVIKVSDVTNDVATIPTTNDHTDGSWLATDIYIGELFLNVADDVLQTRTDAGIITLNSGGGGSSTWGSITGTLSSQTDLQNALDLKVNNSDYTPAHSVLVQQSGTGSPTSLSVGNNTLIGRVSGGGSNIDDLSVSDVKTMLSINNVDNTSDLNKPVSTAQQTAIDNTTLIATLTVGTDRTLILTDRNKNIENDNSITITVPLNSSVAFPIGTQIFFTKKVETMDFAVAGGVTLNSVDSLVDMGRINCGASLLKIDTDEWNLIGELV